MVTESLARKDRLARYPAAPPSLNSSIESAAPTPRSKESSGKSSLKLLAMINFSWV
jgi:hypothetical protein